MYTHKKLIYKLNGLLIRAKKKVIDIPEMANHLKKIYFSPISHFDKTFRT